MTMSTAAASASTPAPAPTVRRQDSDGGSSTRQNSATSESTTVSPTTNIWDSAWIAINQVPPPGLTEVLAAYAQKGENDREMLLRILQAKTAEDERIASVASLHKTILELQSRALAATQQQAAQLVTPPAETPALHSPTAPLPSQPSSSSAATHYGHHHHHHPPPPQPQQQQHQYAVPQPHPHRHHRHDSISSARAPSPSSSHPSPPSSYPTLPPIATMTYGEPSRKRSRGGASPNGSTTPRNRHSPEYPLSPYTHSPPRKQYTNGSGAIPGWSSASAASQFATSGSRSRVAVGALLGAGAMEEDGDVKYRRMSSERGSR